MKFYMATKIASLMRSNGTKTFLGKTTTIEAARHHHGEKKTCATMGFTGDMAVTDYQDYIKKQEKIINTAGNIQGVQDKSSGYK